jgi:5'-AMP-activated protein kinase regulatory gamma subunit
MLSKRVQAGTPSSHLTCSAITAEQFGALALPVAEFLAVEHGTAYLGYSATTSEHAKHPFFASANRSGGPTKGDIQLFTCKADTLLSQLLRKIVEERIHRVYVVDRDEEPRVQAVITPTDILRLVSGVY